MGKARVSGNVTAKNITGLKANTVYLASVRAYNTGGTGPSSPPVNVTTKKSRKYGGTPGRKTTWAGTSLFLPSPHHLPAVWLGWTVCLLHNC